MSLILPTRPWQALASALAWLPAAATALPEPAPAAPEAPSRWEGAIGLQLAWSPEYSGAERRVVKATPAIFLRYGRLTITNASGFRTKRSDDVMRGLGLDLVQDNRWRVNVALRFDNGRSESSSGALAGLGDVKPTLRARATAGYTFDGPWRLGASWSVDAFGSGGGSFGDLSGGWEHALGPASRLSLGASLTLAHSRYMQSYYGITPEQSARTGYPVYTPGSGARDLTLSAGLRHDFGPDWTLLTSASTTRLLGPAAASPLTGRKETWGLGAALAWRF
jgi:outer membrane protein